MKNTKQRSSFNPLMFVVLIGYFILYIPIITLIVCSFNASLFAYHWQGFSLRWYIALFQSFEMWNALYNSLFIAALTVTLSIMLGMLFIFYSARTRLERLIPLFYGTLSVPEIVLAVGLLSLFSFLGVPLGFTTLIAGHTLLGLGYVIPLLHTAYLELDNRLVEASLDLGATKTQTFFKVVLPLLAPSLGAAALLVFVISFDDFLISLFCSGASTVTLPMFIFSSIRSGASPLVHALSTVLLCISSICLLLFSSLTIKTRLV